MISAAVTNTNPEVVLELLNAGADPAATDGDGKTVWGLIQENDALNLQFSVDPERSKQIKKVLELIRR